MPATHVFVVQRGTALYDRYEDRFIAIVGVFAALDDANAAVRACRREFMEEFGISDDDEDDGGFAGFCYEDRGEVIEEDGRAATSPGGGTPVGFYWEFDDGSCWHSCGVECFPLLGSGT